jgi:hypothetical protein
LPLRQGRLHKEREWTSLAQVFSICNFRHLNRIWIATQRALCRTIIIHTRRWPTNNYNRVLLNKNVYVRVQV